MHDLKLPEAGQRVARELRINWLMVDRRYQRPTQTQRAKKIAAAWDGNRLGLPIVSDRGSEHSGRRYAIIDGAHRVLAAEILGYESLSCLVLEGISVEEEARLFLLLNGKTPTELVNGRIMTVKTHTQAPSPLDAHKAGLFLDDPLATMTEKTVAAAGFAIGQNDDGLNCVSMLKALCRRDKKALTQALLVLKGCATGPGSQLPTGSIIQAVFTILRRGVEGGLRRIDPEQQVIARIQECSYGILSAVLRIPAVSNGGGTIVNSAGFGTRGANAILQMLNRGRPRRNHFLLLPQERRSP